MGDKTAIEWADATWNPIRARHRGTGVVGWACVRVSPGCEHCYAERLNTLRGTGQPYTVPALKDVELFLDEQMLTQPLRWTRPRRIFVASMTDLFMEQVPEEWIDKVFAVMALAPQHTFQVLTKRAERMQTYLSDPDRKLIVLDALCEMATKERTAAWKARWVHDLNATNRVWANLTEAWPLPTVWLGISAEDQRRADERIPWLLKTPAAVLWVSYEPALGPVDFSNWLPLHQGKVLPVEGTFGPALAWIVCGGESGGPPERALVFHDGEEDIINSVGGLGSSWRQKRRWSPKPETLEWVRNLRDQCQAAGVAFFHKQWGGPTPKSGGRLLDGRTWEEYPRAEEVRDER